MAFQLRRGTNAQRLGITPLQGELIYTTDTKNLFVGDGTTVGGTTIGGGGAGTTYSVSAETATGGANLRLTGSDASIDNVKLAEGANVTITRTDASTITISSTGAGGASNLNDLGDVVIVGTPAVGEVLRFDSTNWSNYILGLGDMSDVIISGVPSVGQVLKYNGTEWTNGTDEGLTYAISAETVIGGANIRLTGSDASIDNVKLESGPNITISQIDANTISIEGTTDSAGVQDIVGGWLETATNTGITFTYDPLTNALTSTVDVGLADMNDAIIGGGNIGEIIKWDSGLGKWVNDLPTIVDDPAPQLGGSLDMNNQQIFGPGSINLNGTAEISTSLLVGTVDNSYNGGITVSNATLGASTPFFEALASASGVNLLPCSNYLRSRGGFGSEAAVAAGDVLHALRFMGLGTSTTTEPIPAAAITAVVDPSAVIGSNFAPGAILFSTRNDAGTLNNVLVLNKDGVIRVAANTVLPAVVDEALGPVEYLTIRITDPSVPVLGYRIRYLPLLQAI